MRVVKKASRTLSQIACQSISLAGKKPVLLENAASARAQEEGAKIRRGPGRFQNDAALFHLGIGGNRNHPVTARGAHRRSYGKRERDDAGLGRARFHELKSLRDVLTQHELICNA